MITGAVVIKRKISWLFGFWSSPETIELCSFGVFVGRLLG